MTGMNPMNNPALILYFHPELRQVTPHHSNVILRV